MKTTICTLMAFMVLVLALFFTTCVGAQKGSVSMQEQSAISLELAKLTDADYFNENQTPAVEIPRKALNARFLGIAIGAPTAISIESHDRLPLLLVNAESAKRSAQLPLTKNAMVVAADLDSGIVRVDTAFPGDPSKSPGEPPQANTDRLTPVDSPISSERAAKLEALGIGNKAGAVWLDMRSLLNIPWKASRLSLRIISYDLVSNPVITRLQSQESEATTGFPVELAQEIRQRASMNEQPVSNLEFVRSAETPKLPGKGVALSLGRNNVPAGTEHLVTRGAVRIELSPEMIIQRSKLADPNDRTGLPAAVVRTMLLLTATNQNQPARIPVDIPIWSTRDMNAGEVVDAAFSVDLIPALSPMKLIPGSYCIYLIAGQYISGPHILQVEPKR